MEKFSLGSENLDLRKRIAELEKELAGYRSGAHTASNGADAAHPQSSDDSSEAPASSVQDDDDARPVKLDLDEFRRYGRQMIMTEVGLDGQLQLKRSKVLLIGAGGLGCPAAAYLAGAGIGTIGIVDHDLVEPSNLHRQIMHAVDRIGTPKVTSIITSLNNINPYPRYVAHNYALSAENAIDTLDRYDLVLDCTDSPQTRYMISDACVLLGKPLVSASALRSDGQLVVLNNPPGEGPCYRCVFPRPPPPESVLSCGEGGVLGPVVGAMGVLMATEALKVLLAKADRKRRRKPAHLAVAENSKATAASDEKDTHAQDVKMKGKKEEGAEERKFYMTIYSAFSDTPFKTIRMFGKRKTCQACSPGATITKESMKNGSLDYVAFCGGRGAGKYPALTKDEVIEVQEYQKLREKNEGGVLIDVRDDVQYGMCSLENSINVPLATILTLPIAAAGEGRNDEAEEAKAVPIPSWLPRDTSTPIYFICRLGNDSRLAVQRLKRSGLVRGNAIKDVNGGLWEWSRKVDKSFPIY
ncbi:Urmylation protein [Orbilia brochopaga]|uniref:Adenylyltransferase and sulfurtransferase uba4 n=1 Tax=Orbilia brochopaga TaxID=3140254 RepID=A0AAV9UL77_9PEZI